MSVYFAQVGRYVKIGYSENPERRVRRLFQGTTRYSAPRDAPRDLASRQLIRYIDGDKSDERLIHRALADFAVGTEWFIDEPEVRDFIATVEQGDKYAAVTRPAGPAFDFYDERNLPPQDQERLGWALEKLDQMLAGST